MKIGIVQMQPVSGDVAANLASHQRWTSLAVEQGVDLLVFPELSLTGYEPSLAQALATTKEDERFEGLQRMSDRYGIWIGAGMPIKEDAAGSVPGGEGVTAGDRGREGVIAGDKGGRERVQIGMVIFRPDEERIVYAKQYLHADEQPFFVPGKEQVFLSLDDHKIALAICYELSVADHSANAYSHRADIYLASVAKTAAGVDKAMDVLSGIACTYSMTVLMVNSVGPCDDGECAGGSMVIDNGGEVMAAMSEVDEGMLVYDTATGEVSSRMEDVGEGADA